MGDLLKFRARPTAREDSRRSLVDLLSPYAIKQEEIQDAAGRSIPVLHLAKGTFESLATGMNPWTTPVAGTAQNP